MYGQFNDNCSIFQSTIFIPPRSDSCTFFICNVQILCSLWVNDMRLLRVTTWCCIVRMDLSSLRIQPTFSSVREKKTSKTCFNIKINANGTIFQLFHLTAEYMLIIHIYMMMMKQHTHNSKMHLICQAQITRSNFSFHYIQFLKHDSMKPAATYTMYETKFVMQIGIRMTTFGTIHTNTYHHHHHRLSTSQNEKKISFSLDSATSF